MIDMEREADQVADIIQTVLTRTHDPQSDLHKMVEDVALTYGEDAIHEFVRATVRGDLSHTKAGSVIFDDESIGRELGIAVTRYSYKYQPE